MPRLQGLCARLQRLRVRRLRRVRPGILCVGWGLRLLWLSKRAALVAALHFALAADRQHPLALRPISSANGAQRAPSGQAWGSVVTASG